MPTKTMIMRTIEEQAPKPPSERNPFIQVSKHVSQPKFALRDVGPVKDSIRFVAVAMPWLDGELVSYGPSHNDWGVDPKTVGRQLFKHSDASARQFEAAFLEAVETALVVEGADVVCFSELAFPTFRGRPLRRVAHHVDRLAKRHGALIVAGTAHDHRTLMNTGLIFSPSEVKTGRSFHKHVSALAMGERVEAPSERNIVYVRAFGFKVAILICLDLVDYSLVAAAVRASELTDMVLACCLTEETMPLEGVAAAASAAIGGYTVMVNGSLPSTQASCRVRFLGRDHSPEHPSTLSGGAKLWSMELNRPDAEHRKNRVSEAMGDHRLPRWLFGHSNLDVRQVSS